MNELTIFQYETNEVRTISIENEPWFCLSDVCRVLELSNITQVKSTLDEDGVIINDTIDSMNRKQSATFVNEPELYQIIFQSRKPEAKRFKKWVKYEVLPSIRKTGQYGQLKIPSYSEALRQLADKIDESQRLQQQIDDELHYTEMGKSFEIKEGDKLVREVAKILGVGQNNLFNRLRQDKILSPTNEPYEYYMGNKWFKSYPGSHYQGEKKVIHITYRMTPKGITGLKRKYGKEIEKQGIL